ncbi:F-box only protein 48 isoform X1 [Hypanus sabinus]|uniref:F-box only protein 48 isoform X1 n=2 Tax=Hypanus sabinus TaxID=79690 RepID=UPI0028C3D054|nr:F-box only protein 48 isoform X1 [Hypanus sabinus]
MLSVNVRPPPGLRMRSSMQTNVSCPTLRSVSAGFQNTCAIVEQPTMERLCKRNKHITVVKGEINFPTKLKELQNSPNFAQFLPQELTLKIFSELDIQSLSSAAMTCKAWNYLIENSDFLWRNHCLTTLAVCKRELLCDRASGFSWKVTLVRNYKKSNIKQAWLNGHYSYIRSANELLHKNMCEMDADAWGEILEAELER